MYIPVVRERVQVRNRRGEYLVAWVDYPRQLALVRHPDHPGGEEEQIPFSEIFALWENSDGIAGG